MLLPYILFPVAAGRTWGLTPAWQVLCRGPSAFDISAIFSHSCVLLPKGANHEFNPQKFWVHLSLDWGGFHGQLSWWIEFSYCWVWTVQKEQSHCLADGLVLFPWSSLHDVPQSCQHYNHTLCICGAPKGAHWWLITLYWDIFYQHYSIGGASQLVQKPGSLIKAKTK